MFRRMTDIQTNCFCIVIKYFVTKWLFSTAIFCYQGWLSVNLPDIWCLGKKESGPTLLKIIPLLSVLNGCNYNMYVWARLCEVYHLPAVYIFLKSYEYQFMKSVSCNCRYRIKLRTPAETALSFLAKLSIFTSFETYIFPLIFAFDTYNNSNNILLC